MASLRDCRPPRPQRISPCSSAKTSASSAVKIVLALHNLSKEGDSQIRRQGLILPKTVGDKDVIQGMRVVVGVSDEKLSRHLLQTLLPNAKPVSPRTIEFGISAAARIRRIAGDRIRQTGAQAHA